MHLIVSGDSGQDMVQNASIYISSLIMRCSINLFHFVSLIVNMYTYQNRNLHRVYLQNYSGLDDKICTRIFQTLKHHINHFLGRIPI